MTTYIAGPMSGLPEFNYPAFNVVAMMLRAAGVEVRNPAEHNHGTDKPYDFYLRHGLRMLLECDEIIMLRGWENSRGACLEHTVAQALGMRIRYPDVEVAS